MRQRGLQVVAVLAMLGLFTSAFMLSGDARTRVVKRKARLIGEREVPGPGDPNGFGTAAIVLKKRDRKVCFRSLRWGRIEAPTAAHIHKGRAGRAGPVKVTLFAGEIPASIEAVRGCVKSSRKQIRRIKRHPKHFYVNIHNHAYPDGAIRGQLHRRHRRSR